MLQHGPRSAPPYLRPLKKKGFKAQRVTTMGLDDLGKSRPWNPTRALKLKLLSCIAHGCFCDTHMQAPLVATRATRPDATTQGYIHPPLDLAPDEIDIHARANIPRMIARGTPCEGRAQVVPVRVPARPTPPVVHVPPHRHT